MQPHTDMFKNQRVLGGIRSLGFSLFIFAVVLVNLASVGLAAETASVGKSVTSPGKAETPPFPYLAEITGDNVNFRSGPGTNFYECGKLNKGDKVKVVSKRYSWFEIVPPAKSFSWISMQYVKLDQENPGFGLVTGDRVRVYAGSDGTPPHYSTSLQGKLNQGEKVKLLGQQLDDYYKIAPPASAYFWVSTYFTKPAPPTAKVPPADVKPSVANVKLAAGDVPQVVKIDPSLEPKETGTTVAPKPIPAKVTYKSKLEQYQALRKKIEAERAKPVDQQDYKVIKKELTEIASNKEAVSDADKKAARYSQFVLRQVEGFELALAIKEKVQTQNEQLSKAKAEINETRTAKLTEVKKLGRFAVIGEFKNFTLYGPGNYRIVGESGKMLCYALPSGQTKQTDFSNLIGRKVGIVGMIEPHLPTKKAMVRFSEIVPLD
ncbi:MAG: hypothetical protein U9Q07_02845 [Planctomycetota bacterium]|nr:hypothetical protein [Planctomycetota bacterium]